MNNKYCIIFFFNGWVCVSPTILNTFKLLNENGYNVIILTTKNDYSEVNGYNLTNIIYFKRFKHKFPFLVKIYDFLRVMIRRFFMLF